MAEVKLAKLLLLRFPEGTQKKDMQTRAHARMVQLLAAWTGLPEEDCAIQRTDLGRPYLPAHPELGISFSYSGNTALLGCAEIPLGVDLETVREKASRALAKRILSGDDFKQFEAAGEDAAFLTKQWVRLEAYLKYKGTGFAAGLPLEIPGDVFIAYMPCGEQLRAAVCAEAPLDIFLETEDG